VAADGSCPHEQAALAEGTIRGDAVDCPRHHYLFDLRTGRNLYPYPIYPQWKQDQVGDLSLAILPCREECGWIWVTLEEPTRVCPSPSDGTAD
jgi:nitrite reductase/ring-hydroxylating ferredoxin subunit